MLTSTLLPEWLSDLNGDIESRQHQKDEQQQFRASSVVLSPTTPPWKSKCVSERSSLEPNAETIRYIGSPSCTPAPLSPAATRQSRISLEGYSCYDHGLKEDIGATNAPTPPNTPLKLRCGEQTSAARRVGEQRQLIKTRSSSTPASVPARKPVVQSAQSVFASRTPDDHCEGSRNDSAVASEDPQQQQAERSDPREPDTTPLKQTRIGSIEAKLRQEGGVSTRSNTPTRQDPFERRNDQKSQPSEPGSPSTDRSIPEKESPLLYRSSNMPTKYSPETKEAFINAVKGATARRRRKRADEVDTAEGTAAASVVVGQGQSCNRALRARGSAGYLSAMTMPKPHCTDDAYQHAPGATRSSTGLGIHCVSGGTNSQPISWTMEDTAHDTARPREHGMAERSHAVANVQMSKSKVARPKKDSSRATFQGVVSRHTMWTQDDEPSARPMARQRRRFGAELPLGPSRALPRMTEPVRREPPPDKALPPIPHPQTDAADTVRSCMKGSASIRLAPTLSNASRRRHNLRTPPTPVELQGLEHQVARNYSELEGMQSRVQQLEAQNVRLSAMLLAVLKTDAREDDHRPRS